MKRARGNRPELFEPGARVRYQDHDLHTRHGVVQAQSEHYVHLTNGQRVAKAAVLGPDRREGEHTFRVIIYSPDRSRIPVTLDARTHQDARTKALEVAQHMLGPDCTVGGSRIIERTEES